MVKGIEKFREAFSAFSENYVIIGGTACDAVLSKTMVEPRATHQHRYQDWQHPMPVQPIGLCFLQRASGLLAR